MPETESSTAVSVTLTNAEGHHEITEDVKTIYDLVVCSMDYGSGFLDGAELEVLWKMSQLLGLPVDAHLQKSAEASAALRARDGEVRR